MNPVPLIKLTSRIAASNLGELTLPYRLTFAVTNRCQARCAMCNIWQKPPGEELTLTEIDTLFMRASRFSWINLTGGEIFQRSDSADIISTIIRRSKDLYLLNFPTNGFQCDEIVAVVRSVLAETRLPRLIVSISMDGPPGLHDSIRGLPGSWDRALRTYRELRQLASERFSVYLGYTIQSANMGRFFDTVEACRNKVSGLTVEDFHVNLAHFSGHYYDNAATGALPAPAEADAELTEIEMRRRRKIFDPVSFVERRYQRHLHRYLKSGRVPLTCQAAAASCFIDATGTVFPCSVFNSPLGTLRDNNMDLYRLWKSAERKNLREGIRSGGCPGCWTPCEAYQTLLANLQKRGFPGRSGP